MCTLKLMYMCTEANVHADRLLIYTGASDKRDGSQKERSVPSVVPRVFFSRYVLLGE